MRPIQPEQRVKVMVPIGAVTYPFDAKVLSVSPECFHISIPRRSTFKFPVQTSREVRVVIPSANGLLALTCRIMEQQTTHLVLQDLPQVASQTTQRRQFKRLPMLPLIIAVVDIVTEWGQSIAGRLKDISSGGCAIELTPGIMDGTEVRLTLHLPTCELVAKGQVTHCQTIPADSQVQHQIGIRFDHLEPSEREKLDRFVEAALQKDVRRKTAPLPSLEN